MSSLQQLHYVFSSVAEPAALVWLYESCEALQIATDPADKLSLLSAMARRKAGLADLGHEAEPLQTVTGPLPVAAWTCGDAARVILILTATATFPDLTTKLIEAVYRLGDESERAIVTRSLSLQADPVALKHIAAETGRVNSLLLFSALALDNPYPAAYFTDHEFNQLVLKSLFLGLDIERISGLQGRANAELSRMCEDYIDERAAANRTIPRDIWLAMNRYASARGKQRMLDHLAHEDQAHRYNALRGLRAGQLIDSPALELLRLRLDLENDHDILQLLQETIAAS